MLAFGIFMAVFVLALTGCKKGADAPAKAEDAASTDPITVEEAVATVHAVETTIVAQGTLSPGQGASVRVAAPVAGRLTAVLVREGDHVRIGQPLATLDNRPQKAQVNSAQAALRTSETQARQADTSARAAETDQTNSVRQAKLALNAAKIDRDSILSLAKNTLLAAQTDLKKTRAGARPQEVEQAAQAVNLAKATRDRAASEVDRIQFLFDKGISAKRTLEDVRTALAVSESTLASAQQQSSLIRAGARSEDLQAAELRVEAAQSALTQAQSSGDAKIAQAEGGLRQARESALTVEAKRQEAQAMHQTAAQRQADLTAATATASISELRAPIDGIVMRRTGNPGDVADPTIPILEIADPHSLNLLASLPAAEGAKVRIGMTAHVQTTDLPDKIFNGNVLSAGQVDPLTNLITVRIAVANADALLKSGTFATAEIVVGSDPKAVVVPKSALINHDGKMVVFTIAADSTAHQQEVEVGSETEKGQLVAILSGVKPGIHIVKLGQYELTDGAKIRLADKSDDKAADKSDDKKDSQKGTAQDGADGGTGGKKPAAADKADAKAEAASISSKTDTSKADKGNTP